MIHLREKENEPIKVSMTKRGKEDHLGKKGNDRVKLGREAEIGPEK